LKSQDQIWKAAIAEAADSQRAAQYLSRLTETEAAPLLRRVKAEAARILVSLFSGSIASAELLCKNPEWVAELTSPGVLDNPRREEGFRQEVTRQTSTLLKKRDYASALDLLRRFKQKELVRIAARDLAHLGTVGDLTQELSDLADVCLGFVLEICWQRQSERLGLPYHQDASDQWHSTAFALLGLGKLGGQELNYYSDVDVLFVYEEEGTVFKTPPARRQTAARGLTSHQFFCRVVENLIAEVSQAGAGGSLYRMDLRLRPEGRSGPLARSLPGYENYYAQWGQTWERLMLGKARWVAGNEELGTGFLETIQPFRYPRAIGARILGEVAAIKTRIELEVVKAGELERNVKLGRGGIREIEFVAQSLQLLHAGRMPFLQGTQTLAALEKLVQYKLFPAQDAADLAAAYLFLRALEHRLQMEDYQQTHTIPTERRSRERLARLMDFGDLRSFEAAREQHARNVRRIYEQVLGADKPGATGQLPGNIDDFKLAWVELLTKRGFQDAAQALQFIRILTHGPGYGHVSSRTTDLARELVSYFLDHCPGGGPAVPSAERLSDPDRVLVRLDAFVSAYGARATLFEAWISNLAVFKLLLLLFDRSEYLAETAIRAPDLVDEIETSGRLGLRKTELVILKELQRRNRGEDEAGWLQKYQRAEFMRIGLRDILGLADFDQSFRELTALADACLQYALDCVSARHRWNGASVAILGLGKLGGCEINYGSDLDMVFVTDGADKELPALQKLAAEIIDLLGRAAGGEIAFTIDTRLRPDGEKGLLINNLEAYRSYYKSRAALWEIQSLTRLRPVAGDKLLGERFYQMTREFTDFRKPAAVCYSSEWKQSIHQMRARIEKERTPPGSENLALKTGVGGLVDAEFVAQTFCLETGYQQPNTLEAIAAAADLNWLPASDVKSLFENYSRLRRVEAILRRWSFQSESVLPSEPAALRRVALRCGYAGPPQLLGDVSVWRAAIRRVYAAVFSCARTRNERPK